MIILFNDVLFNVASNNPTALDDAQYNGNGCDNQQQVYQTTGVVTQVTDGPKNDEDNGYGV